MSAPAAASFSPLFPRASPFFSSFSPPFPRRAAIFSPLPACRFTPWALSRLSVRCLFFLPSLKCSVPASSLFSPPLYCMLPFFLPFSFKCLRRPQLSFLPSLSPVRRFLNVILNLFQDLIILFIRLSLFVKCMRCRNEFGMTIRCVWATKTSSSPLRGEGDAQAG